MTIEPGDDWSDEQLDMLQPDQPAIRTAKTFAAAWATGDGRSRHNERRHHRGVRDRPDLDD